MQSGVAQRGSVTDLSPGMVKVATRNGKRLGLDVDGRVADAEGIPYEDNTFDLVVGHAVLHHIPDVELSLREVLRVLKPGGRFVFAGEPTTVGNCYARWLADLTWKATIARDEAARAGLAGAVRRTNSTRTRARRRWNGSSTCTPSSRATWSRWRPTPAPCRCAPPARNSPPRCSAGRCAPSSRRCRRASSGWGWAKFAFGSWTTLSWVDANVLAPRGAEGLVLQRDDHRGQTVLSGFEPSHGRRRLPAFGGRCRRPGRGRRIRADRRHPARRHRRGAARFGDRTPALVETVAAAPPGRGQVRRAAGTSQWLFTDEALQQATAAPVAAAPGAPDRAAAPMPSCTTRPVRSAPSWRRCGA